MNQQIDHCINDAKQMATINPKNLCKAWFAIKDFINKEEDPKKAAMFVSFKDGVMEVAGTDKYSLAICQIEAETNIQGTFALSLFGSAYDEFNAFIAALYASVRSKEGMQISQLLCFKINKTIATLNIYEPTLFEDEPSLQINLRLLDSDGVIQYKKGICDARERNISNTFFLNLEILQRVQRVMARLAKQSIIKVMREGNAYVMLPSSKVDDCELYYIAMGMVGGDITIDDFEFESVQADMKIAGIFETDDMAA